MPVIDMASLQKEGEFGSKPWCEACAAAAVQILKEESYPKDFVWAFTEHYTHPPARFLENGRSMAAYYIMIKDGEVTGGDGAPEEALALPGFLRAGCGTADPSPARRYHPLPLLLLPQWRSPK